MSAASRLSDEALELAYDDPRGSDGEREAILFVHGFSHNRAVWRAVCDGLPDRFRPIAVDLRGHGESAWSPEGRYDLSDYARDLPVHLDRLGIARAHVVAHSLGGNVCTLFAAAHPWRVSSLTLVDTGPALAAAGSHHVLGEVADSLRSFVSVAAFRSVLSRIHPLADPGLLDALAEASLVRRLDGHFEPALDPGVLGVGVSASSGRAESVESGESVESLDGSDDARLSGIEARLWQALGSLRCPVLLLRGGASSILSEQAARRMVDEVLEDARLELMPAAGHAIMLDDAVGLRERLVAFLESSRPSPSLRPRDARRAASAAPHA